jgi:hypothetical protein
MRRPWPTGGYWGKKEKKTEKKVLNLFAYCRATIRWYTASARLHKKKIK